MHNRKGMGMKEKFDYWFWSQELSPEICQDLINLGEGKWNRATIDDKENTDNFRKSDVVWSEDQWIYDLIWPFMRGANEQAGWKYEISAAESCQIARYTKDGFYTWHNDGLGSHNEVCDNPDYKLKYGNTRKLSMSIILNDDFEGGDFEIHGEDIPELPKGSVIVFPSFMRHRVAPVTAGIRYSLVTWFLGPPFK